MTRLKGRLCLTVTPSKRSGQVSRQALYYGMMTKKIPAVYLIMEDAEKDNKYLKRIQSLANSLGLVVVRVE